MSYKSLKYHEQYKKFLEGALEDLGYKVNLDNAENIIIDDKKGHASVINDTCICFLMGATVEAVGKWLDEIWRDEE